MTALSYARHIERNVLPAKREWLQAAIIPHSITYPKYTSPSPQSEEFHASDADVRALFGGDRSGKSGPGTYEQIKAFRKYPNTLHWSVALTQPKIRPLWEWHKHWLSPDEYEVASWLNRGADIPALLRHKLSGALLEYKTAKSGPGVFSADKVKTIHIDEDPMRVTPQGEMIINDCFSRIVQGGRLWVTASPILGKNWMYKRLRCNSDVDTWIVSLDDNRFISDEEKRKAKARMTEDEIARRYYGLFTSLSGACFKEFREDVHCLKEEPYISAAWRRIRVIDFGYNHPFYCLWMAQDPDGALYLYDEHHQNETLLHEHARIIYEKTKQHEAPGGLLQDVHHFRPIEATVADWEAQQRAELENPSLGAHAIYTTPAIKHVDLGIQAVNRYLKVDERGKARLYISPRCPVAQRQFGTYRYKQIRDGGEVKEVVYKLDDEAPDCARYGVMYFDEPSSNMEILTDNVCFF